MTGRAVLAATGMGALLTAGRMFTLVPFSLLSAFVGGRLLGVRRSWSATVVSAAVGGVGGVAVAVVIARAQVNQQAGFTRNAWLFSLFLTMSTSLWIELLAKPGALARARTGLRSIPRPLRSARRKGRRLSRYVQISAIAARYGLGKPLGISNRASEDEGGDAASGTLALRVRCALEECGGVFVKLGQVLSTRSDLVPPAFVAELCKLQDRVAPAERSAVEPMLEAELRAPVDRVFAEFDWDPVAAASIGQAYRATLRSGERVIVKVQRPGIAEAVERDVDVLLELARTAEERTAWAAEYRVRDLAGEFADRLREELDFRMEARNAADIAANLGAGTTVVIPRVHDELTTGRVLVMEWLDGVSVRQSERLDASGYDRVALADGLLRCSLQQMLIDGHFHADPHPGNVMVLRDGRLGLIDFGAAGRLDSIEQSAMREMMLAVRQRDAGALRQAVVEVATLRQGFDDEQLERALARFMARQLGPGSVPSAAMFNELLRIFFDFGITLPPEMSTLFRAMVTLEGTLTTLSPGFLIIDAAQELVAEWAREGTMGGSLDELVRRELVSLAPLLRRLPRHVDRLATIAARGNLLLRLRLLSDASDVRLLTAWLNRLVLAFLGGVVGVMSVVLLGIRGGPPFTGSTTLFQLFGYFGLFCSTVLVMRVLVAVFRDGLN